MIIHKLIAQHLTKGDDQAFYAFQAQDALRWIEQSVRPTEGQKKALDLGCGHGVFGGEMLKRGWDVTFSDEVKDVFPQFQNHPFVAINLDRDDLGAFGQYDLIICSNVLEHLSKPKEFLSNVHKMLATGGRLYLSWTNWLSPWGGHEFSPFHYLGPRTGHKIYDKIRKRKRKHTPYENLYPTYIGDVLRQIEQTRTLKLERMAPRYYTEFAFITRLPVLREFITWNCAMLLQRTEQHS